MGAEFENPIIVNEYEGSVLGQIDRKQPLTRYQLLKALKQDPTTTRKASKGSLYPLVGRMVDRGFVSTCRSVGGQQSELLSLTEQGRKALNRWIVATGPEHSFSSDPLLLRVMSLGSMPRDERIRWIAEAKDLLLEKKRELGADLADDAASYERIVQGTVLAIVNAKLEWLDRLLIEVVRDADET